LYLLCLAWCAVLSGCSNPDVLKTSDILAINNQIESKAYVLWPGDIIAVKLLYNNELSDEVVIRTDGKISLQPLGDVTAAGLTLEKLDELLTREYGEVVHVLDEGDSISVRLQDDAEFSDQATVSADGKVSLNTVGEVEVAGLTQAQLRTILAEKYSEKFEGSKAAITIEGHKLAEVTVILKSSAAQKIYIGGEVLRPGMIPIVGMLRATDALFQAGGHVDSAELEGVLLIRHGGSAKPNVCVINMREIMRGKTPDIRLEPYDVIFVPRTAIAEVSMFIQSLIPVQFNAVYNINPEVTVK
jgi:polysaccharide export outer membrane protein